MQTNAVQVSERATLAPKKEREIQRTLAPLFSRNVVSRVVSGRDSYVESSHAIDGAPFLAIVEAVLDRLIDECARVTRESEDFHELNDATLASSLLRCTSDAVRNRDALGFRCACDCPAPFKLAATKGCKYHGGRTR